MDWLANHSENGQTFQRYCAFSHNKPEGERQILYLQPLEEFQPDQPDLETLRKFMTAYFGLEVRLLDPPKSLDRVTTRADVLLGHMQLLTGDLLDLLEEQLPEDAFCVLGVTNQDLYPQEDWSFVFGVARFSDRVGVYSLARYDPVFFRQPRPDNWKTRALQRSCKVLAHETGHMLGLAHCIHYHCVMNGSNHLAELDSQPLFLCPLCLRKLNYSLKPDLGQRYRELAQFCEQQKLQEESEWLAQRLKETAESRPKSTP